MRQIGNTHNDSTATLFENRGPSTGSDATSEFLVDPLALDPASPGIKPALVDVDLSSLHSKLQNLLLELESNSDTVDTSIPSDQIPTHQPSIADWSPTDFTPFKSSLVAFDSDISSHGASNQRLVSDGESASVTGLDVPAQDYGAPHVHTSSGILADTSDVMLIPTNAASNQNTPLYLLFSALGGGQPDHSNAINIVSQAPIFTSSPVNEAGGDNAGTKILWDGERATTGTPQIIASGGGSSATGGGSTTSDGGSSSSSGGSQSGGLIINVSYDASVGRGPAAFMTDVAAAVQYFESHISNPITINIDVGYGEVGGQTMGGGALGQSLYYLDSYNYSTVKNALVADAKSANDMTAIATLPSSDPTNGGTFWTSTAEAKALGLDSGSFTDGYVGFSSAAGFD